MDFELFPAKGDIYLARQLKLPDGGHVDPGTIEKCVVAFEAGFDDKKGRDDTKIKNSIWHYVFGTKYPKKDKLQKKHYPVQAVVELATLQAVTTKEKSANMYYSPAVYMMSLLPNVRTRQFDQLD